MAKVTGDVEARLVALASTKLSRGFERWSLRLLERQVLLIEGIPPLDHSTIGRVLKKEASSSPEEVLDHPAEGQRRVRRGDRGRPGGLPPALRPRRPGGVHG